MNDPREIWELPLQALGKQVLVFDRTDSTNSRAAALAFSPSNHGLAILADVQTSGRGQKGRAWTASPCSSVLLSLLLFPSHSWNRPSILTGWAACSVCSVVEQLTGKKTQIKWPNDVLVDGKKICGILIEQNQGVVVGIGLNVNQTESEFLEAGLLWATSIGLLRPFPPTTHTIARLLLSQLDADFQLLSEENIQRLEQQWVSRLGLLDQAVIVECARETYQGILVGLSFCRLDLLTADGLVQLEPERVLHLLGPGMKEGESERQSELR